MKPMRWIALRYARVRFGTVPEPMHAWAKHLSASPVVVDDTLTEKLRERLGEKALVELTALIAIENQRSRFNIAMGVMPQGWSRVCALPTHAAERRAVSTV